MLLPKGEEEKTVNGLVLKFSIEVNATPSRVWEALTRPEMIKEYLFGAKAHTTWTPGSPITFTGKWEGKAYEDRGTVLEFNPPRKLSYTYWSQMSGLADIPENYKTITFEIIPMVTKTQLYLTQDNNIDEESKAHSEKNWRMVLEGMKGLVEGQLRAA